MTTLELLRRIDTTTKIARACQREAQEHGVSLMRVGITSKHRVDQEGQPRWEHTPLLSIDATKVSAHTALHAAAWAQRRKQRLVADYLPIISALIAMLPLIHGFEGCTVVSHRGRPTGNVRFQMRPNGVIVDEETPALVSTFLDATRALSPATGAYRILDAHWPGDVTHIPIYAASPMEALVLFRAANPRSKAQKAVPYAPLPAAASTESTTP